MGVRDEGEEADVSIIRNWAVICEIYCAGTAAGVVCEYVDLLRGVHFCGV